MRPRVFVDPLEIRRLLAVFYVDANAPGTSQTGASWTNAFKDLQAALALAQNGDDIRIANGTYKPTSGTDRTITFNLKSGVDLIGGYAGYGASNPNMRDPSAYLTTLSGEIGSSSSRSDNSIHVLQAVNLTDAVLVDGFKITRGYANGTGVGVGNAGGGLYAYESTLSLKNLRFVENFAQLRGGGLAFSINLSSALLSVYSSSFTMCDAEEGGGMWVWVDDPGSMLSNLTFTNNKATQRGSAFAIRGVTTAERLSVSDHNRNSATVGEAIGGTVRDSTFTNNAGISLLVRGAVIRCEFRDLDVTPLKIGGDPSDVTGATVVDSIFENNYTTGDGGAVLIERAVARFYSCDFINNRAANGGAIAVMDVGPDHGRLVVTGSRFYANRATHRGGAIFSGDTAIVANSIFVGNSANHGGPFFKVLKKTERLMSSTARLPPTARTGTAPSQPVLMTISTSSIPSSGTILLTKDFQSMQPTVRFE